MDPRKLHERRSCFKYISISSFLYLPRKENPREGKGFVLMVLLGNLFNFWLKVYPYIAVQSLIVLVGTLYRSFDFPRSFIIKVKSSISRKLKELDYRTNGLARQSHGLEQGPLNARKERQFSRA